MAFGGDVDASLGVHLGFSVDCHGLVLTRVLRGLPRLSAVLGGPRVMDARLGVSSGPLMLVL